MRFRVDCHAHIIAPARFPYADGPGYRPRPDETGDAEGFAAILAAQDVTHAVLVQPSCYGEDNAAMLDAMEQSHGRYKGIAVVSPQATENELLALKRQGIVGVRLHLVRSSPDALSRPDAADFLARLKAFEWFVEVYAVGPMWSDLLEPLRRSGVKLLIAHRDVLKEVDFVVTADNPVSWQLEVRPDASRAQRSHLGAWLRE